MSMSSEQAFEYLNKLKSNQADDTAQVADTTPNEDTTPVESNEVESKSEDDNVASPDNATKTEIQSTNDNQSNTEESNGSGEPSESEDKIVKVDEPNKNNRKNLTHKDKRDYAFIRTSQQLKEYKKQVKELTEALEKYKGLESKDFKDKDGNTNYDAYTNWKLQERDMVNEVQRLQQEQLNVELEQDRIATERCFQGQELEDYNRLIQNNGKVFADVIHSYDKNNAIFKYLDTVDDYPIVMRELMTNHNKWLPQIFRPNKYSHAVITNPNILERNTAKVVEQILDEYYASKNNQSKSVEPKSKTAIPVIGKQITNNNVSESSVHDSNYWNNHLREHPKG
jgi:hypothetical protein